VDIPGRNSGALFQRLASPDPEARAALARLPECQDWSHGEVERGWEHGVGCRAGSEAGGVMAAFARGERVGIITPGWTACPLGVVFSNAAPGNNRYCVEPDDGYRHHYLRIIGAADLRARAGHELQAEDERSRLPMCGGGDCGFCGNVH